MLAGIPNHLRVVTEKLFLHFHNNDEIVDDPFLTILQRCKKLNSFIFEGFFEYFGKIQAKCAELGCCLIPKTYKSCSCTAPDVNEKECKEMRHRRMKFVLKRCGKEKVCSVCVMNQKNETCKAKNITNLLIENLLINSRALGLCQNVY